MPGTNILFLCHNLGSDFKFLKFIAEKISFKFAAAIKISAKTYTKQTIPGFDKLANGFPETREELFKYNSIMLYNVDFKIFTAEQLRWIADFVKIKGGGLCVFGENKNYADAGPVNDILPVETEGIRNGIFTFKMTDEGAVHEIFSDTDLNIFKDPTKKELIEFDSCADIKDLKAGSTVLGVMEDNDNNKKELPFIVIHRAGAGRVFFLGTGGLWKWRMLTDKDMNVYENFWRQSLLWLAIQNIHEAGISIKLDKISSALNDILNVELECFDEKSNPIKTSELKCKLEGPSNSVNQVQIVNDGSGKYRGKIELKNIGINKLIAEGVALGKPLRPAKALIYVKNNDLEFKNTEVNEQTLKKLAGISNGIYLRIDEIKKLYENLDKAVETKISKSISRDIWDNPIVLLLILIFLTFEWIMRKVNNLF